MPELPERTEDRVSVRVTEEPQIVDGFVVVGDEAYLPEDWARIRERAERRRQRQRDRWARMTPEQRARRIQRVRAWQAANRDKVRAVKRDWMRAKRPPPIIASLHTLSCTGPTVPLGCVCGRRGQRKIPMRGYLVEKAS